MSPSLKRPMRSLLISSLATVRATADRFSKSVAVARMRSTRHQGIESTASPCGSLNLTTVLVAGAVYGHVALRLNASLLHATVLLKAIRPPIEMAPMRQWAARTRPRTANFGLKA